VVRVKVEGGKEKGKVAGIRKLESFIPYLAFSF